jgi:hypothetical protein
MTPTPLAPMESGFCVFRRLAARDAVEISGDMVNHGRNRGIARVLLNCREERFEESFLFLSGGLEHA